MEEKDLRNAQAENAQTAETAETPQEKQAASEVKTATAAKKPAAKKPAAKKKTAEIKIVEKSAANKEKSAQDIAVAQPAQKNAETQKEQEVVLQAQPTAKEKIVLDVPTVGEEAEVASFAVSVPQDEEIKPAEKSTDEIAKELSEEISAEEKAKIEAAQQKADKQYHDILGDRRIKKPSKLVARIIAAVIIILLVVVVVTKLPMFFNCMVPNGDTVKKLPYLMGQTNYDAASTDEEVWNYWDYDNGKWCYFDADANAYRPTNLPNDELYTQAPYAAADRNIAKNCTEVHLRIGKKQAGYELSDLKYVTVILYEFDSVDKAKEYGQSKAEQYKDFGGQHDFQDLLIYKLGMAHAETDDFIYDAWYNGGNYIEVYAPDKELADKVRQTLNYNA